MRTMKCRNVRHEIETAERDEVLSLAADNTSRLARRVPLSAGTSETVGMVSSLGTIEAPGDFEFRLRARLAGKRRQSRITFIR